MSRKTLLTEAEVRQFLKLANIGPVGDAKVQEMYSAPGKDDDLDEKQRTSTKPKPPGQRDAEQIGRGFRIIEEQLIEIPPTVEQQFIRVLRLDAQELLHHRSMCGFVSQGWFCGRVKAE